jgi:hypothetical protein
MMDDIHKTGGTALLLVGPCNDFLSEALIGGRQPMLPANRSARR